MTSEIDIDTKTVTMDRVFSDYELVQALSMKVAERNDLITKARSDLTARELKIMDFLISKIKPEDTEFEWIETSAHQISKVLDISQSGKNYQDIRNSLRNLRNTEVIIRDDENMVLTQTGWVEKNKFYANGNIDVLISSELKPYLLGLITQGNYTQYELDDVVKLKSKHSIILYKFMREADKNHGRTIATIRGTVDEFKKWFNVNPNMEYAIFNRDVIKKAVNEINKEIPSMELEVKPEKNGRRVVRLEIVNKITKPALIKQWSD